MKLTSCKACGNEGKEGITLLNAHICQKCEENIINLDTNDILRYEYYKMIIKNIWKEHTIAFG